MSIVFSFSEYHLKGETLMKRKSILGLLLLLALLLMSASICLAGGGTIGAHMDQHGYHTYSRTLNESKAN